MEVQFRDDERGRPVAVKRAETPEEASRLRREADLLDVATHPALVELLAFDDGPQPVLQTAFVGPSLTVGRALEVDEIAGVLAAAASTLADLHEMGLVHGAVALDHVLLDHEGRPVLCSLGAGGLAGERSPAGAGAGEGSLLDPATDVFGLGVVLAALLARANGRSRTAAGDALRRLAESALAAEAADRPSARHLADAVHDAVPSARLPATEPVVGTGVDASDGGGPRTPDGARPLDAWRRAQAAVGRRRRTARRVRGLVGVAGVVAAGAAGRFLVGAGSSSTAAPPASGGEGAPAAVAAVTTTSTPSPTTVAPATGPPTSLAPTTTAGSVAVTHSPAASVPATTVPVVGRADCPVVAGPLVADVNGDGCAESIRYVAGVVEAGGARWAVGEPDDVVAVGDWACTGTRSLAVLRPRTGEVFTFNAWATAGHEVRAPLLTTVPGGQTVRAADLDSDGCNELVVERASGAPAVLRAPR